MQRVGYGLVDLAAETITVELDRTQEEAQSLAGVLRLRDVGSYVDDLERGGTIVVRDARGDPRTQAHAEAREAVSASGKFGRQSVQGG